MITRSALTASGRALMATPALGGVLRQAGFVRGFADPANKPVDRFAEYLQSGEPDPSKGKDEIPDHSHAYGDDPVATIAEVREEETSHPSKDGKKKSKKASKKE
ncbi:hypothetical protein QBZ16_001078 [Prototheca wickerhamii]|uniref:Uncharacterized protein n=1 Tax=Prototheca wickerhamii TaxID=3111 RepID=A0AAD9IDK5_PROWI|nr:hypothetical protein QBZ16_001078 [Prototheca wickerhamii]